MARALACRPSQRPGLFRGRLFVLILLLTVVVAERAFADPKTDAEPDPFRYRSGVRSSFGRYRLTPKHLTTLAESLRAKTGFLDLRFDADGFLTLGDRARIAGGSVVARNLIQAAVDGPQALILEDRNASRTVTFAKLTASLIYQNLRTGQNMEARMVQVDFSDFGSLKGDRDVLAAFDVGFVVLHEFAHGALGLRDAANEEEEPGECETYINQIRRDLALPERLNYHARYRLGASVLGVRDRHAELTFARTVRKDGKQKIEESYLSWNSTTVGESSVIHRETTAPSRAQTTTGIQ